jgi:hypothetical protein
MHIGKAKPRKQWALGKKKEKGIEVYYAAAAIEC